jgi:hypothetical protein
MPVSCADATSSTAYAVTMAFFTNADGIAYYDRVVHCTLTFAVDRNTGTLVAPSTGCSTIIDQQLAPIDVTPRDVRHGDDQQRCLLDRRRCTRHALTSPREGLPLSQHLEAHVREARAVGAVVQHELLGRAAYGAIRVPLVTRPLGRLFIRSMHATTDARPPRARTSYTRADVARTARSDGDHVRAFRVEARERCGRGRGLRRIGRVRRAAAVRS